MPDKQTKTASGRISYVFGHRFVVETVEGAVLADITPHGLERISLRVGDTVELEGETKPTELKVSRFTSGGKTIEIAREKKHGHDHPDVDPRVAIKAAKQAGFEAVGEPRRKPKHFEVLGRRDGCLTELHIELDGQIRKSKPADCHDPKWREVQSH